MMVVSLYPTLLWIVVFFDPKGNEDFLHRLKEYDIFDMGNDVSPESIGLFFFLIFIISFSILLWNILRCYKKKGGG